MNENDAAPVTVSGAVAAAVAEHSSTVFGVVGNGNAYFVDALEECEVQYVALRHEAGAVVASDAFHRITGKLGVATVTYGAGFTNAVTALQEAQKALTPMVLVAGDAPTSGRREQDTDQVKIAAAIDVPSVEVRSAEDVWNSFFLAVEIAWRDLSPVILSIPLDLSTALAGRRDSGWSPQHECHDPGSSHEKLPVSQGLSKRSLDQVVSALVSSKRPLLLAGRGAILAKVGNTLSRLASDLGALTCSTLLAHGLFEDEHFDLGVAGGFAKAEVRNLIRQADVVLVAGARLNPFTMHFGDLFHPNTIVIQVDQSEKSRHERANLFIQTKLEEFALNLKERVIAYEHETSDWRTAIDSQLADLKSPPPPTPELCDDNKLDPRALADALDPALPHNRILLQDLGNFVEWMPTRSTLPGPGRTVMLGSAYQSIGLGLAGVVGASAADPETTVVLATGDGGLLMALADLESVVREATSAIVVVFNDAGYGAEIHQYGSYGLDVKPMLIPDVDFASLAQSLGASGVSVHRLEDLQAVEIWKQKGAQGTLLLDCKISQSVVGPVLKGIADKLKRPSASTSSSDRHSI